MSRRLFILAIILATAIGYVVAIMRPYDTGATSPTPRYSNVRRPSPGETFQFEIAPVEAIPAGMVSQGTAFSLDGGVHWVTARHVLEPCLKGGEYSGSVGNAAITEVQVSEANDVALITTAGGRARPMRILPNHTALDETQTGFAVGYPNDSLTMAEIRLIGFGLARQGFGRFARQPVSVWTEDRREPQGTYGLGGMSGGPIMVPGVGAVGVLSAELPRRGRMLVAPIDDWIGTLGEGRGSTPPAIAPEAALAPTARALEAQRTIAGVYCSPL